MAKKIQSRNQLKISVITAHVGDRVTDYMMKLLAKDTEKLERK